MKKGTKIIIGLGLLAGAGIGVYFWRKGRKQPETVVETKTNTVKTSTASPVTCKVFPLKIGSGFANNWCANDEVKKLQVQLNKLTFPPLIQLEVDGRFGESTAILLDKFFQTKELSKEAYEKIVNPTAVKPY